MRNSVSPSQKSRSLLRSMLKKYMMVVDCSFTGNELFVHL